MAPDLYINLSISLLIKTGKDHKMSQPGQPPTLNTKGRSNKTN